MLFKMTEEQDYNKASSFSMASKKDAYRNRLAAASNIEGKVQEAVAKQPLLKSIAVPQCDMAARRRCAELLCRVLDTAKSVMRDIDKTKRVKDEDTKYTPGKVNGVSKFWLNHYRSDGGISARNLMLKIQYTRNALAELGDRPQGAVSYVFWNCWDEIYVQLCQAVGIDELQKADSGRLFRPAGEAALFIDIQHATKRRRISVPEPSSASISAGSMGTTGDNMLAGERRRSTSMISTIPPFGSPLPSIGNRGTVPTQLSPLSGVSESSTTASIESPDLDILAPVLSDFNPSTSDFFDVDIKTDTSIPYEFETPLAINTPHTNVRTRQDGDNVLALQSGSVGLKVPSTLNLRERIKLMEEGVAIEKDQISETFNNSIEW